MIIIKSEIKDDDWKIEKYMAKYCSEERALITHYKPKFVTIIAWDSKSTNFKIDRQAVMGKDS